MSGIALIIPGADFSNSPLGKVTFSKTLSERAAEAVEAYATLIGSHTYDEELVNLVETLMTLGVWETIDVFPMLGDTIAKKMSSLNRSSYAIADSLRYPETVSISNGELLFVNTTGATFAGTSKEKSLVGYDKVFVFVDAQRASNDPKRGSCTEGTLRLTSGTDSGEVSVRMKVSTPSTIASSTELYIAKSFLNRHTFGCYVGDYIDIYVDGVKEYTEQTIETSNSYSIYNSIGHNGSSSESSQLWDGPIMMAAFGTIEDAATAKSTIEAFQLFLDSVKPRA